MRSYSLHNIPLNVLAMVGAVAIAPAVTSVARPLDVVNALMALWVEVLIVEAEAEEDLVHKRWRRLVSVQQKSTVTAAVEATDVGGCLAGGVVGCEQIAQRLGSAVAGDFQRRAVDARGARAFEDWRIRRVLRNTELLGTGQQPRVGAASFTAGSAVVGRYLHRREDELGGRVQGLRVARRRAVENLPVLLPIAMDERLV
mmetsp:Transcript_14141/g.23529  ORF Transcript_14141/g.23529 Transcript_14141/m.23529 type:complete len:200 (+) Transcript_14141:785-1384(+)